MAIEHFSHSPGTSRRTLRYEPWRRCGTRTTNATSPGRRSGRLISSSHRPCPCLHPFRWWKTFSSCPSSETAVRCSFTSEYLRLLGRTVELLVEAPHRIPRPPLRVGRVPRTPVQVVRIPVHKQLAAAREAWQEDVLVPHAQRLRARDLRLANGGHARAAGGQWEALGLELLHADGVAEAHLVTVEGEAEGVEDGGDGGGSGR